MTFHIYLSVLSYVSSYIREIMQGDDQEDHVLSYGSSPPCTHGHTSDSDICATSSPYRDISRHIHVSPLLCTHGNTMSFPMGLRHPVRTEMMYISLVRESWFVNHDPVRREMMYISLVRESWFVNRGSLITTLYARRGCTSHVQGHVQGGIRIYVR